MMIRRLLFAALFCCACKDSIIPVGTIRGTYVLTTVNGAPLPYTVPGSGPQTVIVADSITLMESSIFHEAGTRRVTANSVTTTTPFANYGEYSLLSTSFTLHSDPDGSNRTGQLDGNTMTVLDGEMLQIFKKLN